MTEDAVLTRISRNPAEFADYTICHAEKLAGCEGLQMPDYVTYKILILAQWLNLKQDPVVKPS